MATSITEKVQLTKYEGENESKETYFIRKLKIHQFEDTMKIVSEIAEMIHKDENLRILIEETFAGEPDWESKDLENFSAEEIEQLKADRKAEADKRFMDALFGSFEIILLKLPRQTIKLLATASGISEKELGEQDLEVAFDVFDALVTVNDLEALIERSKKSSNTVMKTVKLLSKRRKSNGIQEASQA